MVDLDEVVKGLMRDLGATLRPPGFRGTGGVWRAVTAEGAVVVEKQGSRGSGGDARLFYVNTSVVPRAWWEWHQTDGRSIDTAREADGIRLLEGRVHSADPSHTDAGYADRWRVTGSTDVDRLRADLLGATTEAAARAAELLEPGRYRGELEALPEKRIGHWQALVVLLADAGPTPELAAACSELRRAYADRPRASGHVEQMIERALRGRVPR